MYLSSAIANLLYKYDKETNDLARACKFPEDLVFRWRNGHEQTIAPGCISALARAFATSREDALENHLALLYGHLRDDWRGASAKYISIEVLPTALPLLSESYNYHVCHPRSAQHLEHIRKHIWYDIGLQKTIRNIAKPYKNKPIPKSYPEDQSLKTSPNNAVAGNQTEV